MDFSFFARNIHFNHLFIICIYLVYLHISIIKICTYANINHLIRLGCIYVYIYTVYIGYKQIQIMKR